MVGGLGENNSSYSNEGLYKSSYFSETSEEGRKEATPIPYKSSPVVIQKSELPAKLSEVNTTALLQQRNIELQLDLSIETTTPEEFMTKISNLNPGKLSSLYSLISENTYQNKHFNFIKKLSSEQRMLLLDNLSTSDQLRGDVSLTDKIALRDRLLPDKEEKKTRLTNLVLSPRNKGITNNQAKRRIENFFYVSEIVEGFGYDRSKSSPVFFKKAFPNETYIGDSSKEAAIQAVKLGSRFIDRILETKDKWDGILKKSFIEDTQLTIIKSHIKDEGRIIGVVEGLSMLDDEQQSKVNGLSEEALLSFLDSIISYEKTQKNYNFESANEIGLMLVFANNTSNITSLLQDIDKKGLSSTKLKEATTASIKASGKKLEEFNSSELAKLQTKLIYEKAELRAQEKSGDKWKETPSIQKELSIHKEAQSVLNELIMGDELSIGQQQELNDITQKTFDQNNQDLLIAAEKYGFTEDLKQVRGQDYYTQVEQQYQINSGLSSLEKKIDIKSNINQANAKEWNNLGNTLQTQIFENQQYQDYPLSDFPADLDKQALLSFLPNQDKTPEDKGAETNEQEVQKLLSTKQYLLNETNNVFKNNFINKTVMFLQDALNIGIDQDQQESILSQFTLDDNGYVLQNKEIVVEGNYQGEKIIIKYNIETGELQYAPWLSKKEKNQDVVYINNGMSGDIFQQFNPPVVGPKIDQIGDFANSGKVDYQKLMIESNGDTKKYTDNLSTKVKQMDGYKFLEANQESLKEQYLRTVLMQEMMGLVGVNPADQKSIDTNKYPIYKIMYNSISAYTIQEMQQMREHIQSLLQFTSLAKDASLGQNEKELIDDQENVEKKYVLTLFEEKRKESFASPKDRYANHFYDFFKSMESDNSDQVRGISGKIIEPRKLSAFIKEIDGSTDKTGIKAYNKDLLAENMSKYLVDQNLDKQLDQMNSS